MSINRGREAANENAESGKKPVDIDNITTKVYNDFVSNWISNWGVNFVNNIMQRPESDTSYQDEVMSFINGKKEFDALWEDFRTKMSLWKIKARLAPEYARYKTRRLEMKKLIQKHFNVSEEFYAHDIESVVTALSEEKLSEYTQSSERLRKFFTLSGLQEPQKRNMKWFLENLNIESKLRNFSQEKRDEILYELHDTLQGTSLSSPIFAQKLNNLIHRLLAEWLFDVMQKKELILAFLPTISLEQIRMYNLMTESELNTYINTHLINDIDVSYRDESLRQIRARMGDIEIPTSALQLNTPWVLDTILKNADFKYFAQEIQDFHHLGQSDSIADFDTLKDNISTELWERVTWLNALMPWNFMTLHAKRGWSEEIQYYQIISTRSENPPHEKLVFRNVWWNGVYNASSEKYDYTNYWDFYKLVSNPKIISRLEFSNWDIFDEKLESWELMRVEWEYSFNTLDTAWTFNSDTLRQSLDLLDTNGKKFWFQSGTTFRTEGTLQNSWDDLYTIEKIDEWKLPWGQIHLVNISWKREKIDFETFFETWKEKKAQRCSMVNSWEELITDVNAEKSVWSQMKFENGKLINEWYPKWNQEVEYLVSENALSVWDDTNLIQIHSIQWATAKISFWKYTWKELPNSKNKKSWKWASYSVSKDTVEVSLWMLAAWSKESWLQWKNIKGENIPEKLPESAKLKWWFWSGYVNNFANISSLIAAGKMWGENMKNYFQDGTNEQAMKLASKLPVFSSEQNSAMKMRLEQSEKKHTDEALEKLKVLDSWDATKLVAKWLTNKHTTESRKVGALLYMLEKYGVLYEKNAMMEYKGTFLFYTAFWWTVGDELYLQYKDECARAAPPKQFLEEDLMYKLISKRCKGEIKPPLRGRLYKEVEAIMWKWLTDELEKWKKDADKKGTFKEKEDFAFWELKDGWYPNAMWAFEAMVWKGNTPQRLNKLPFVMLTSWAAKSFSAQLTNKFKLWNLVLTTFFTHSSAHTDLFNRVVVSLCRDIENKLWGKYIWMWDKANKLINGMSDKSEKERIEAAKNFYESENGLYEDILWRSLLMMNTQRNDRQSEFETWLRDKSATNPDYKEYCSLIDVAFEMGADKFMGEQEELLTDAFHIADKDHWGMTWLDTKAFVKKFIVPQSWGVWFRNIKMGNKVWKEIINKIDYLKESEVDEDYKRKRIWKILSDLMDGITPTYAQNPWELNRVLTNPASVFYTRFNSWWVQASDFALWGETFEESKKWQQVINRYVDNILWWNIRSEDTNIYSMRDLTHQVQTWVSQNLNSNFDQAA